MRKGTFSLVIPRHTVNLHTLTIPTSEKKQATRSRMAWSSQYSPFAYRHSTIVTNFAA